MLARVAATWSEVRAQLTRLLPAFALTLGLTVLSAPRAFVTHEMHMLHHVGNIAMLRQRACARHAPLVRV